MTTLVNDTNFEAEVLQSHEPVLVDFFAEWCGPCKALAPVVESLGSDFEGRARVVKLDIDASPRTAQQFGIRSVPTLIVFKDGAPQATVVGVQPKGKLEQLLDRQVA